MRIHGFEQILQHSCLFGQPGQVGQLCCMSTCVLPGMSVHLQLGRIALWMFENLRADCH